MRFVLALVAVLSFAVAPPRAWADDVYQEPETFLAEAFGGTVPAPKVLWITGELRDKIASILGHAYGGLRVRYWQKGVRTAWILEEIGKVKPITTGLVVEGDRLLQLKVLIYRESHGWEVRHDFFTDQFKGATLENGMRLDRSIDGISGATLSVNALTNLARTALLLHRHVEAGGG